MSPDSDRWEELTNGLPQDPVVPGVALQLEGSQAQLREKFESFLGLEALESQPAGKPGTLARAVGLARSSPCLDLPMVKRGAGTLLAQKPEFG